MLFEGQLFALKDTKDKKEVEILLAVVGEWQGHYAGSFRIDKLDIERMKQNFDDRKIDIVIDYEHQSLYGNEAPAAGWITELHIAKDGDELWGKVKWTDKAVEYIKNDEYRYLSPVFNFGARDQKSGANIGVRLESVALTNTPFLDELGEVRANSIKERNMDKDPKKADDKVDEATKSNNEAELEVLKADNERLKDELASTKVEAAIVANKIAPSQKEWALKYAKSDIDGFNEFISGVKATTTTVQNDMFANKTSVATRNGAFLSEAGKNQANDIDVADLAIKHINRS